MRHGPIALINQSLPVICVCTKTADEVYEKMLSNVKKVEARRGRIIAAAAEGDRELVNRFDDVIFLPADRDEFFRWLVLSRCSCWLILLLVPVKQISASLVIWRKVLLLSELWV